MKYCNALRLAVLFLASASISFAQNAGSPTLVLQGGTLIDGTGTAPRENGTIVVRGDKILSVLPNRIQPLPEGVRSVDARGKYVLPGLVDGHTHYAGYAAQLYLHYGITSVVDTGNLESVELFERPSQVERPRSHH